jgi:hypothetical protein
VPLNWLSSFLCSFLSLKVYIEGVFFFFFFFTFSGHLTYSTSPLFLDILRSRVYHDNSIATYDLSAVVAQEHGHQQLSENLHGILFSQFTQVVCVFLFFFKKKKKKITGNHVHLLMWHRH